MSAPPPSIMQNVPADVRERAFRAYAQVAEHPPFDLNLLRVLIEVILEERERCAKIADADWERAGSFIATNIRGNASGEAQ